MSGAKAFIREHWWRIALAGFLALLHFSHPLDSDEGITLNAAWRIIHGEAPYRDFFEFVGPVAPYFIAAAWKFFGISYAAAKAACLILLFGSGLAIEYIARSLGAGRSGKYAAFLFAAATVFSPVINHNAIAAALTVLSTAFFFAFLQKPNYPALVMSGLLASLTSLTVQNRGAALMIGLSAILLWRQRSNRAYRDMFIWSAACLLPWLITMCIWPPILLARDLFIFPWLNYPETNLVGPALLICAMSLALLGVFMMRFYARNILGYYLGIVQLLLFASILSRADLSHAGAVMFPMFIFAAIMLERWRGRKTYFRIGAVGCFALCTAALLLASRTFARVPPADFYALAEKYCSGQTMHAGPFLPGLYFELRKMPATAYGFLITRQQTAAQFSEAAESLRRSPPACIITDHGMVKKFGYTQDNPVDLFISQNYRAAASLGGLVFLQYRRPQ